MDIRENTTRGPTQNHLVRTYPAARIGSKRKLGIPAKLAVRVSDCPAGRLGEVAAIKILLVCRVYMTTDGKVKISNELRPTLAGAVSKANNSENEALGLPLA
jgi:hypothetical protein